MLKLKLYGYRNMEISKIINYNAFPLVTIMEM